MSVMKRSTRLHRSPARKTPGISAALMTIAAMQLAGPSAEAATRDIEIPKSVAIAAVNAYASGIEIRLDNWGSFQSSGGGTWYTENSYVRFPSGVKKLLDVPRSPTVQTLTRRYNAYVDDFNTQTIDVKADGNRLKLRIFFESAGNEVRVGCINRRKDKPCAAHLLKHTGDLNNAHVYAWFKPSFSGATIRLVPTDLTLDYDLKLDSWILDKLKNVVSHFVDIKSKVRSAARSAFIKELSKSSVQTKLSANLNDVLFGKLHDVLKDKLGTGVVNFIKNEVRITSIKDGGSNYVVTVKYPDLVTANSVKVLSLKPKSKKLTASCPFNFGFDATIKANTKVSGKTWLEYENGAKSKKLDWSMPKPGKATSTIARRIKGKAGKKKTGWARLVVSWKGTTGKTFTAKSGKAKFTAICSKAAGSITLSN